MNSGRPALPGILLALTLASLGAQVPLAFDEFYENRGIHGLAFSEKLKSLEGKAVSVRGHMAPPLKAQGDFFVLTRSPVALCPFCDSDKDWPVDLLVAYLDRVQFFTSVTGPVRVTGILETGVFTDASTGFVSRLRLRHARWEAQ